MDGKRRRIGRQLKVEQDFERSRLERELLAAAYERVLPPVVAVLCGGGLPSSANGGLSNVCRKEGTDLDRALAIGGL